MGTRQGCFGMLPGMTSGAMVAFPTSTHLLRAFAVLYELPSINPSISGLVVAKPCFP